MILAVHTPWMTMRIGPPKENAYMHYLHFPAGRMAGLIQHAIMADTRIPATREEEELVDPSGFAPTLRLESNTEGIFLLSNGEPAMADPDEPERPYAAWCVEADGRDQAPDEVYSVVMGVMGRDVEVNVLDDTCFKTLLTLLEIELEDVAADTPMFCRLGIDATHINLPARMLIPASRVQFARRMNEAIVKDTSGFHEAVGVYRERWGSGLSV